jgi:MFS family permease
MTASPTRAPARALWAIGLGTSVVPLDTAVNIAFPSITGGFGRSVGDIQWVVVAHVLTYASLTLAFGRIADIVGHARVFRVGIAWSAVALLLCALAPSFPLLLAARFLQGVGAALVLSCGVALVTGLHDETRRSRMVGAYSLMLGVGGTLGPWVGGVLVELSGWPAVFWFRVPIAIGALALLRGLPMPARAPAREPFDLGGAALLALTLLLMLLTINRVRDLVALPLGLGALGALAVFVRHERRVAAPVIDLGVFRLPGFAALNLAHVFTQLAGFTVWLLVPYYLARATTLGPGLGGLVLATAAAGAIVAAPLGGRLIGRVSAERLVLVGAALVGIGLALIALWDADTPTLQLLLGLAIDGLGLGLFQMAYTDICAATLPLASRGVAGSLAMVTRTVGAVAAAAGIMLIFETLESGAGFFGAYRCTFLIAAAIAFAMTALLGLGRPRRAVPA